MATHYTMQQMKDLNHEGKVICFPKMILRGQCSTQKLAKEMEKYSTFSRSEIMGILTLLSEIMSYKMANGYSVKLDEIGTFTPTLKRKHTRSKEEKEDVTPNARSIEIAGIHFRADKTLKMNTALQCKLERRPVHFGYLEPELSPAQRLNLAQKYAKEHAVLTVKEYEKITGLRHSQAALELKQWSQTPESGITAYGKGSHKVYICDKTTL